MGELRRRKGLDLDENLTFQQREWRTSKVLWGLLLLLMLATGLGLFGNGPLSHTRTEASPGGFAVEYDRFGRYGASMRLVVRPRAGTDGSTDLEMSRSLVEGFLITQITPAPAATDLTRDSVHYRFDASPGSASSIIFDVQPRKRWSLNGYVRSAGETVWLRQFIYP